MTVKEMQAVGLVGDGLFFLLHNGDQGNLFDQCCITSLLEIRRVHDGKSLTGPVFRGRNSRLCSAIDSAITAGARCGRWRISKQLSPRIRAREPI